MSDILVIDADAMGHDRWRDLFEERGHETTIFDEGSEAFSRARIDPPDAVLIDMEALPSVGQGFGLVENLRMELPDAPIVVVAGGPLSLICGSMRELGADVCVSKPVDYLALARMMDLLLRHVAPRVQKKAAHGARAAVAQKQLVR